MAVARSFQIAALLGLGAVYAQTPERTPAATSSVAAPKPLDMKDFKNPDMIKALAQRDFTKLPEHYLYYLNGLNEALANIDPKYNTGASCTILEDAETPINLANKMGLLSAEGILRNLTKLTDGKSMKDLALSSQQGRQDGLILIIRYGCDHSAVAQIYKSAQCLATTKEGPKACEVTPAPR